MQNSEVSKSGILSFKPRQVILLAQQSKIKEEKISTIPTLDESLLDYFYRNGFAKTVKRFQSEAQIQSDAWKASPSQLRLEDIFCKYNSCNADSNKSSSNTSVLEKDEALQTDKVCPTNEEKSTKKKKKNKKKNGTVESDNGVIEDQQVIDKKMVESSKSCGQISEDAIVDEQETKPKKKKKTKHNLDSSIDELEKPVDDTVNGLKIDYLSKKSKDKKRKSIEQGNLEASTTNEIELVTGIAEKERKKKKKKSSTESAEDEVNTVKTDNENEIKLVTEVAEKGRKKKKKKSSTEAAVNEDEVNTVKTGTENGIELVTEVTEKERKKKMKKKPSTDSAINEDEVTTVKTFTVNETISKKEKSSSKKRKRSLSDDDENVKPITEMTVIEESKCQKTKISKENSKSEGNNAQETSNKLLDEQTNGKVKVNGGEKSGALKSKKKERNATAEPKTVNAFQRVKIEQVEFAHEKLQDNSYWAKDGAEIGYGAKAQEVLGQVRGRWQTGN